MYDVVIIGGGAAGMDAAIYAARYKMKTLIVSKIMGGTFSTAHKIENWLGIKTASGVEITKIFENHIKQYDIDIKLDEVTKITKLKTGFKVWTKRGSYSGKTVIIASGMRHRKLNIPGEKEFLGKGISYCYTCDGPFFKNKVVAVVGGSDSAAQGALMLTGYAKKVYVIYRKKKLRAEPITTEQVEKHKKIKIIYEANVKKATGTKFLEKVKLDTGKELALDGLFIEIGSVPISAITEGLKVKTIGGFIKTDDWQKTNVPGVYAAGDICENNKIKQMISAAAQGATAAISAFKFIKEKKV